MYIEAYKLEEKLMQTFSLSQNSLNRGNLFEVNRFFRDFFLRWVDFEQCHFEIQIYAIKFIYCVSFKVFIDYVESFF